MADDAKPTEPVIAEQPAPRKRLEKGYVRVRVLKLGHGKIHTGKDAPEDERFYEHGDEPSFPQSVAQDLEDCGFVEIQ